MNLANNECCTKRLSKLNLVDREAYEIRRVITIESRHGLSSLSQGPLERIGVRRHEMKNDFRHHRARQFQNMILLALFGYVHAFNKEAHDAIGMTAASGLDSSTNYKLKSFLQGRDIVDISNWAHTVESENDEFPALHFMGQSNDAVCVPDKCPNGRCLKAAIKGLYDQVIGVGTYQSSLTDSDAVMFLINLIGDLHQPMHLGRISNDFGRTYPFSDSNLFDFWDSSLVSLTIERSGNSWWSGWTNVASIGPMWEREKQSFQQKGLDASLDDWANENAKIACTQIYNLADSGSEEVVELWQRILRERILLAGARTAIVLNQLLSQKSGNSFRGGSSFVTQEKEPDENEPSQKRPAWINLLVLVVVIFAVFVFNKIKLGDVPLEKVELMVTSKKAAD